MPSIRYSKALVLSAALTLPATFSFGQAVSINGTGTAPDAQSILDITSTTKGVLLPRLTTAQATTLAASLNAGDDGMIIYDTNIKSYKYWDGVALVWQVIPNVANTGNTLDQAYDEGGAGVGRTIIADNGPVQVTGTTGTFSLDVDKGIKLAEDQWVGLGNGIERLQFDGSNNKIDVDGADLTVDDGKWIGIDGSNPRVEFDDTNNELNLLNADIGIGTSAPDDQSLVDIRTTTKGVLFPRMTTVQRDAIGQGNNTDYGLWIYNTTTANYNYWDGLAWQEVTITSELQDDDDWYQTNTTNAPTAIGDWIYTNGNVGINTGSTVATNPLAALHVQSNIYVGDYNTGGFYNTNATIHVAKTDNPHILMEDMGANTAGLSLNAAGLNLATENGDVSLKTGVTYNGSFSSTGSTRLIVKNGGNVGIGTTSPDAKLNVGDPNGATVYLTREDASTVANDVLGSLLFDSTDDSGPSTNDASAGIRAYASVDHGNSNKGAHLTFFTKNNVPESTAAIERLRIQANGNVGIGTAAAAYKVHIGAGANDGVMIGNYNDQLGWNGTGTAPQLSLRFAGYRDVVGNFTGAKIAGVRTNLCCSGLSQGMELAFYTQEGTAATGGDANLTERLRIGNGGNLGVGTATPVQKLHVVGNGRFTSLAGSGTRFVQTDNNGDLAISAINPANILDGTGVANYLARWTDANTLGTGATQDNGTDVGIGVAPGTYKLNVAGTMQASTYYSSLGSGNVYEVGDDAWLTDINTANFIGITGQQNAALGGIRLGSNSNAYLYSNGTANIGIGTYAPLQKLDVGGHIRSTGNYYINNASPTVFFQDADQETSMIHMNSNLLYFLSGSGANTTSWSANGSLYPLTINMTNDVSTFGGEVHFMEGSVGIGTNSPGYNLDVSGNTRTTGDFYGDIHVDDTRAVNDPPTTYNNEVAFDFKQRSVIGVPGSGAYSGNMTFAPWGDDSGDASHQVNFNEGGLYWRQGQPNAVSWGAWDRIVTESALASLSGSGNWIPNNGSGDWQIASNSNATGYSQSSLELRETNFAGSGQQPPRLGFHWGGVVASQISIESDGKIAIRNNPGNAYESFRAQNFYIQGVVPMVQGYSPPNNAIRMTPNFHFNTPAGYAMIVNWDNGGVGGTTQQFRVGNGSGTDQFYVRADGGFYGRWFGDLDDAGYYLDPNSTSREALRIRGGALHGPNPSWGKYLSVGANGREWVNDGNVASIATTNGNIHIDAASGYDMYLNFYDGNNIRFGRGNNTERALMDANGLYLYDGWFRPDGAEGIYFQSYGGGWHMSDATWIRSYGSKNVYVNTTLRADGGLESGGGSVRMRGSQPGMYAGASGYNFNLQGVILESGYDESGGFQANGNNANIWSPGDADLVRFYDEDGMVLRAYINGGTGAYVQASDRNKKQNIQPITSALDKVLTLGGYTYEFKLHAEEIEKNMVPTKTAGVIAQEVDMVMPEIVDHHGEDGIYINYDGLTPYIIEAIKEQQAEIDELSKRSVNISDFGIASIDGTKTWVEFTPEFVSKNQSQKTPVVTVTPMGTNASLKIIEITALGFTVEVISSEEFGGSFNWIAMAKTEAVTFKKRDMAEEEAKRLEVLESRRIIEARLKAHQIQAQQAAEAKQKADVKVMELPEDFDRPEDDVPTKGDLGEDTKVSTTRESNSPAKNNDPIKEVITTKDKVVKTTPMNQSVPK